MPIGHCSVNHAKFTLFSLSPQATLVPGEDDIAYDDLCSLLVIHITGKTQLSATSAVWNELHNVLCDPMSIQPPFT